MSKPQLFRPGQSGNPSGRPKLPDELKDATPLEIKLLIWRLWKLKRDELQAFISNPDTPAGQLHVASVLAKGIKEGDPVRLDYLLNRLIGKVKEVVELNGTVTHELPSIADAVQILAADYACLPAAPVTVVDLDDEEAK